MEYKYPYVREFINVSIIRNKTERYLPIIEVKKSIRVRKNRWIHHCYYFFPQKSEFN